MQTSPKKLNEQYSYKDYLFWTDENERWELIDGIAYDMSPAPLREHQDIVGSLFLILKLFFKDDGCKVYVSPFDVRLPGGFKSDEDVDTVVQPDISVFCDKTKLDDRGANGAPDLIIEILSPSTASKDLKEKFFLYERVGVKEYWILDSYNKTLTSFILEENGKYARGIVYTGEDVLKTVLFDGLEVKMGDVFA